MELENHWKMKVGKYNQIFHSFVLSLYNIQWLLLTKNCLFSVKFNKIKNFRIKSNLGGYGDGYWSNTSAAKFDGKSWSLVGSRVSRRF